MNAVPTTAPAPAKRRSAAIVCALLLAGLGSARAFADPSIGGIERAVAKGRRLDVTITTESAKGGMLTIDGTVNGRHLRMKKRVRPGTREVTLKVDPKRARLRKVDGPIEFDFGVSLSERRTDVRAEDTFRHTIPCPLILVPGLGNEQTPGGFDLFATTLDATAGGSYRFGATNPSVFVHEYDSASGNLALAAKALDTKVKAILKGSIFTKVDVVGYSMGGLVARRWLAEKGAATGRGKVRRMLFLCTPNEGAPVAYIANTAIASGTLDTVLGGASGLPVDLASVVDSLASPEALRTFYPSYGWATITLPFFGSTVLPPGSPFLPDSASPLTELNATAPDPSCEFHAIYYSSVITQQVGVSIGTVDKVDATSLLSALGQGSTVDLSQVDLASIASGSGDGVVPAHSVAMDDTPAWKSVMTTHDVGAGFHLTATIDPQVSLLIALLLAGPSN